LRSPESLVDHGHMLFPCMKKLQGYMGSSSYLTFPGWWPLSSARCPPVEAHLSCNKRVQRSLRHWAGTPLTVRCLWKKLRTSYEISVTLLSRPLQVKTWTETEVAVTCWLIVQANGNEGFIYLSNTPHNYLAFSTQMLNCYITACILAFSPANVIIFCDCQNWYVFLHLVLCLSLIVPVKKDHVGQIESDVVEGCLYSTTVFRKRMIPISGTYIQKPISYYAPGYCALILWWKHGHVWDFSINSKKNQWKRYTK
jgi:hypothetical protein